MNSQNFFSSARFSEEASLISLNHRPNSGSFMIASMSEGLVCLKSDPLPIKKSVETEKDLLSLR